VNTYCSWCGGAVTDGSADDQDHDQDHDRCLARLASVDPPRYCPECARRMVVQVDPMGWTARCSRHGEFTGGSGTDTVGTRR